MSGFNPDRWDRIFMVVGGCLLSLFCAVMGVYILFVLEPNPGVVRGPNGMRVPTSPWMHDAGGVVCLGLSLMFAALARHNLKSQYWLHLRIPDKLRRRLTGGDVSRAKSQASDRSGARQR